MRYKESIGQAASPDDDLWKTILTAATHFAGKAVSLPVDERDDYLELVGQEHYNVLMQFTNGNVTMSREWTIKIEVCIRDVMKEIECRHESQGSSCIPACDGLL